MANPPDDSDLPADDRAPEGSGTRPMPSIDSPTEAHESVNIHASSLAPGDLPPAMPDSALPESAPTLAAPPDDSLMGQHVADLPTPPPVPMLAPDSPFALQGTPYRLQRRLGRGGMGDVYLGEHIELGRNVAIKLLNPRMAGDRASMERLRREARAAARIGNPHIVDVYDLGISTDGRPYVVMRYVEGRDLLQIIRGDAPVPPRRVVQLTKQICSALRAAHSVGIVHRDLKPENVMVEVGAEGESVTVLDFGIAHTLADTETRLTREGEVMGTPGYMAPEQALNKAVDGRADQYSLAAICYELLSGRSPYKRETALQVIAAQITSDPEPLSDAVDPQEVTPDLQAVVMRGLAREPDQRYADITAFATALESAWHAGEEARPTAVVPPPAEMQSGNKGALKGAAIAALLLALAGLGYGLSRTMMGGSDLPDLGSPTPTTAAPTPAPAVAPDAAPPAPADAAAPAQSDATPQADPDAATPDAAAPDAEVRVAARPTPPKPAGRRRSRRRGPATNNKPETPVVAADPPRPDPPEPAQPDPPPPEPAPAPEPPPPEPPPVVPAAPVVEATPPKPKGPPQITVGAPSIRGDASKKHVKAAIKAATPRIKRCTAGLAGLAVGQKATVTFLIDEEGFFDDFSAKGNGGIGQCGVKAIKRERRLGREPDTGTVRVSVTISAEAP